MLTQLTGPAWTSSQSGVYRSLARTWRAQMVPEVPGIDAGQVHIRPGSPFVDRPLGDTRARTRAGASIVAIVRGDEVLASPGPAEILQVNDILVVIGTEKGITGVEHIVDKG